MGCENNCKMIFNIESENNRTAVSTAAVQPREKIIIKNIHFFTIFDGLYACGYKKMLKISWIKKQKCATEREKDAGLTEPMKMKSFALFSKRI